MTLNNVLEVVVNKKKNAEQISSGSFNFTQFGQGNVGAMFRLIAVDFSLLSPASPCELSEREVTSPSNLKVVGALDNCFCNFYNFLDN